MFYVRTLFSLQKTFNLSSYEADEGNKFWNTFTIKNKTENIKYDYWIEREKSSAKFASLRLNNVWTCRGRSGSAVVALSVPT